jgi:hypothetical protein
VVGSGRASLSKVKVDWVGLDHESAKGRIEFEKVGPQTD